MAVVKLLVQFSVLSPVALKIFLGLKHVTCKWCQCDTPRGRDISKSEIYLLNLAFENQLQH